MNKKVSGFPFAAVVLRPTPAHVLIHAGSVRIGYRSAFLHWFFHGAAALGNELFYITFFPLMVWCVDEAVTRRTITWWVLIYYVGQLIKDVLRLPRPPSPPVLRLERHYEVSLRSKRLAISANLIAVVVCCAGLRRNTVSPALMRWRLCTHRL
jgi:hypothetical protein